MNKLALKSAGVALAGLLVAGTAAVVPAQAAPIAAPAASDKLPASLASNYLAAQVGANGVIRVSSDYQGVTSEFDDYGLTIDAATALDAVGGQGGKVTSMTDAVLTNAGAYTKFGPTTYANSTAKLTAWVLSQGRTGTAVDNLKTQLNSTINSTGPTAVLGRISDQGTPSGDVDYATTIGQAYAAQAVERYQPGVATTQLNQVLDYLFKQQCTGNDKGFFRAAFGTVVCNNDTTAVGDVDTTAIAVLALQAQLGNPEVAQNVNKAVAWLVSAQAANGSFNNGNANSTGLAGWVLGLSNRPEAAKRAATWLRQHQLVNAGACAPYAAGNNGAVVLDDLGLANANATKPLSAVQNSVATRATAQALPALVFADGGPAAGETTLSTPAGYVPDSSTQTVTAKGAPGNVLCVTSGTNVARVALDANGNAAFPVAVPAGSGATTVTAVDGGGETDTATLNALGATSLTVKVKGGKAVVGRNASVKVKGLASGEQVKLKFRGATVGSGKANERGVFKTTFKVAKAVKGNVKAVGTFKDRSGKDRLVVVKRRR